jgi:DNA polymerase-3 subunit gamma/tau
MAVAQAVPEALDSSEPDSLAVTRLSSRLAADEIQLLYSMALHGRSELSLAPDEHSGLVMVLLRMLAFSPPGDPALDRPVSSTARPAAAAAVASGVARREVTVTPAAQAASPAVAVPIVAVVRAAERTPPPWVDVGFGDELPAEADAPMALAKAEAAEPGAQVLTRPTPSTGASAGGVATSVAQRWSSVVDAMACAGSISAMVRELAQQSQCMGIDEAASPPVWALQVDRETLRSAAQCDKLEAALKQHLGTDVRLEVRGGAVTDTPALRNAAERDRRQRQAEQIIHDDAAVRSLMEQYPGARIVPGSVKYQ